MSVRRRSNMVAPLAETTSHFVEPSLASVEPSPRSVGLVLAELRAISDRHGRPWPRVSAQLLSMFGPDLVHICPDLANVGPVLVELGPYQVERRQDIACSDPAPGAVSAEWVAPHDVCRRHRRAPGCQRVEADGPGVESVQRRRGLEVLCHANKRRSGIAERQICQGPDGGPKTVKKATHPNESHRS